MALLPARPVAIYLRPNFLSKAFTADERLQIHLHTYAFLTRCVSPFHLTDLFGAGVPLFSREGASCVLATERKANNQGEMSLTLSLDGAEVYALGFNFALGAVFGLNDETVVFIGRNQGLTEDYEPIRRVTKLFGDVTPQALLFAAAQGLADALGLRYLLAPGAAIHPSRNVYNFDKLKRAYDDFFAAVHAEPLERGFVRHDRRARADILDDMPAKHRARTKAKRRLKAAIAAESAERLAVRLRSGDDAEYFVAPYLHTRVGALDGGRLVATGAAGCLLFGPYIRLEPGSYEAEFALEGGPHPVVAEVTAEDAEETLARLETDAAAPVRLAFTLDAPRDEVEFRLFVGEEARVATRGVRLTRT